jgi:RNA polymerase sigma-70 factor (ECF subfamily)
MLAGLEGDPDAYARFLGETARCVRDYLSSPSATAGADALVDERVEELTQDILLGVHAKRHTYLPEMPLLPWILAIARYRLIDALRSDARSPETEPLDRRHAELAAEASEESAISSLEIEAVLAGLGERQREVLTLAKLSDMPLAQVARKMDMSLSAVKVTVHRAIRTLRRKHSPALRPAPSKGGRDGSAPLH